MSVQVIYLLTLSNLFAFDAVFFCSVCRLEKVKYITPIHLMAAAAGNAGPRSKPSTKLVSLAGQPTYCPYSTILTSDLRAGERSKQII